MEGNCKQRSWTWFACFRQVSSPRSTNKSLQIVITLLFKHQLCTIVDYSVNITAHTLLVRGMTASWRRVVHKSPAPCERAPTPSRSYFITCLQSRAGSLNWEAPLQNFTQRIWESFWPRDRPTPTSPWPFCSRYYGMCETDDCAQVTLTSCCQHNFAAVNLSRLSPSRTRRLSREIFRPRGARRLIWRGADGGALNRDGKESLLLIVGV